MAEANKPTDSNPLAGMENKSVDEKICALMALWVRYEKEFEIMHHLSGLTAIVAHQYAAEILATPDSPPAKTKALRRTKKAA